MYDKEELRKMGETPMAKKAQEMRRVVDNVLSCAAVGLNSFQFVSTFLEKEDLENEFPGCEVEVLKHRETKFITVAW